MRNAITFAATALVIASALQLGPAQQAEAKSLRSMIDSAVNAVSGNDNYGYGYPYGNPYLNGYGNPYYGYSYGSYPYGYYRRHHNSLGSLSRYLNGWY